MDERASVLVVDNDETLLCMFRLMFETEGYRCETCTSAQSALELIDRIPFQVMLTDIVMPDHSGLELTEKAKRLRPHMIIIAMTGFIDDFTYDRAIEAGASDFIKKPFTLLEIMHRISQVKLQENLRMLSITNDFITCEDSSL